MRLLEKRETIKIKTIIQVKIGIKSMYQQEVLEVLEVHQEE